MEIIINLELLTNFDKLTITRSDVYGLTIARFKGYNIHQRGAKHWDFVHHEYDGAPDANDKRSGVGYDSLNACLEAINDLEE